MTYAIGLTGGIGSGKSTVAAELARHGASVVDTDAIAHALTGPGAPALRAIRDAFGPRAIGSDGALDRARMRETAFADPQARRLLEAILHPPILAEADRQARAARGTYVVLVVPLLFETGGYRQRIARALVVDCPAAIQLARTAARPGLDEAQARRILAAQWPRWRRLQMADDVAWNGGTPAELASQCERLHARYAAAASAAEPA
jgi:dephospho-CoA kinase